MSGQVRSIERLGARLPPSRRLLWYAVIVDLQLVAAALYYALGSRTLGDPRYVLYGLLWINVGLLAVYRSSPPAGASFETRRRALAVAAAYFGLLAVAASMIGTGVADPVGFRVATLTFGWGPALLYEGSVVSVVLMPAYVVGYLSLAYLVYVAVLEAATSVVGGLLGLLSCVSCTWPIAASVASTVLGGAGFLALTPEHLTYDVSTAVFLATVALLYWRPGFGE